MADLCDDLQNGLGQIDHELLNHSEDPDGEFMDDQVVSTVLVDGRLFRSRQDVSLSALGVCPAQFGAAGLSSDDEFDFDPVYRDYTAGMEVAIDVEQVSAGSCARLPCSRGKRFKR